MGAGWIHLTLRRRWLARRVPPGALQDLLRAPLPPMGTDHRAVSYLALDLETSGFNADHHEILSVGFVPIDDWRVQLGGAVHLRVRPTRPIPEESAILHGLTEEGAEGLQTLEDILPVILRALTGRVMIAHFSRLEVGFLNAACKRLYGHPLALPVVDTLLMEQSLMSRRNQFPKAGELRLWQVRSRYNLPRYRAHNALSDALGAGELFLAQMAHRGDMSIGEVLR